MLTLKYCMYHPETALSNKFMHMQVVIKGIDHAAAGDRAKKMLKKFFCTNCSIDRV